MSLKVYHVVRQYHPSIGGLEDVVYNIAQQQLADGAQTPVIVTLDRLFCGDAQRLPAREIREGVEVIRLPYRGSSRYPLCPKVLGVLGEADVVHVHGVDFFFDFLAWTRFWHGKPLLASSHGIYFHTPFASGLKKVFFNTVTRLSALAYRKIVATSDNDGRLFRQICADSRVEVIENGVNLTKFRQTASRERLQPVIIYFGRWSENKGLLETLALFACLHRHAPQWRLIIAGREYDHDADELSRLAQELGVAEAVQIVPSPSNADLAALIAQASYFICQSHHEGFGLAAIEAMSAGLYPLLSHIPPFAKLVAATGLGLLLGRNQVEADSQAILARHQALAVDYPAVAHQLVQSVQPYSWVQTAQRYLQHYRDMAKTDHSMETSL
ncbi:glycosyltransferase family 4 protein [Pseudaeromonas paramecii]|uniref:Glycosyltransferase family 4 protein n=1 Tax=Pseudaeromonas paramecii TaxID=2138166 RepID=A0ABP8PV19_9GAMM